MLNFLLQLHDRPNKISIKKCFTVLFYKSEIVNLYPDVKYSSY